MNYKSQTHFFLIPLLLFLFLITIYFDEQYNTYHHFNIIIISLIYALPIFFIFFSKKVLSKEEELINPYAKELSYENKVLCSLLVFSSFLLTFEEKYIYLPAIPIFFALLMSFFFYKNQLNKDEFYSLSSLLEENSASISHSQTVENSINSLFLKRYFNNLLSLKFYFVIASLISSLFSILLYFSPIQNFFLFLLLKTIKLILLYFLIKAVNTYYAERWKVILLKTSAYMLLFYELITLLHLFVISIALYIIIEYVFYIFNLIF